MENKKILIIDDDPDIVEAMKIILESKGYKIDSANNGTSGLKKIKENKPDLIILDVMMADDTEGFRVANKLKSKDPKSEYKEFINIPVIMITAINDTSEIKYSLQDDKEYVPVDEWLDKPVHPDKLLKTVGNLLNKK
jgi:CheY-like chemotaxis protein